MKKEDINKYIHEQILGKRWSETSPVDYCSDYECRTILGEIIKKLSIPDAEGRPAWAITIKNFRYYSEHSWEVKLTSACMFPETVKYRALSEAEAIAGACVKAHQNPRRIT